MRLVEQHLLLTLLLLMGLDPNPRDINLLLLHQMRQPLKLSKSKIYITSYTQQSSLQKRSEREIGGLVFSSS